MKQILKLTKVELRRLLMNKKTYILICINVLLIALGYNNYIKDLLAEQLFYCFTSANMNYVIFPFCLGCLEGSLIWGISLILDADRFRKNGTLDMVKAYTREEDISIARILAYNIVVFVTFILSAVIYLPVCIGKLQYLFDIKSYLVYTLVSMLPGMIITLFFCEGIYIYAKCKCFSFYIFTSDCCAVYHVCSTEYFSQVECSSVD